MKKVLLILAFAGAHAFADTSSFVGSLDSSDPNSFALFPVTLAAAGALHIQTWGYGGGINAAGTMIAGGGFDPYVSLFAGIGDSATSSCAMLTYPERRRASTSHDKLPFQGHRHK